MRQDGKELAASDAALLQRFVRQERQAAFSELIARYSGLVYSACLRDIGNAAVAEDAAQAVFLLLARKAPIMGAEASLAGWLYRTARLVSRNAARQEARVRRREQRLGQHMAVEAAPRPPGDDPWDQIEPLLHAALDALGHQDREAILLRFFEDRSLKEIGTALGLSEDAARMRVSRSLEKMRRHLAGAGVALSAALLAGLLTEKAVQAAPAALQHLAPLPAPGPNAPAGSASIPHAHRLAQGAIKMMWINKAIIAGSLIMIGATGALGTLHARHPDVPLLAQILPAQSQSFPAATSAQTILAQAAVATNALKSLQSDLNWTLSAGGATVRVAEHFDVQRPNLAHLDTITNDARAEWSVADGASIWRFRPETRRLSQEPDAGDGRGIGRSSRTPEVFVRFFFDPSLTGLSVGPDAGVSTVRFVGEQAWRGGRYQVIELKQEVENSPGGVTGYTTLAFFGDDHLLHRAFITTLYYDGTVATVDASLSNAKPNVPIAASRFVLVPTANATFMNARSPSH